MPQMLRVWTYTRWARKLMRWHKLEWMIVVLECVLLGLWIRSRWSIDCLDVYPFGNNTALHASWGWGVFAIGTCQNDARTSTRRFVFNSEHVYSWSGIAYKTRPEFWMLYDVAPGPGRCLFLQAPVWFIMMVVGCALLPAFIRGGLGIRRIRLGMCWRCSYDLRGGQSRCSECGEPAPFGPGTGTCGKQPTRRGND